jgi:hypothetical protein
MAGKLDEKKRMTVEAYLTEYRILAEEVNEAKKHQSTIMYLSLAVLGALTTFGANIMVGANLLFAVLFGIVGPFIIFVLGGNFLFYAMAILRAGQRKFEIEYYVNETLGGEHEILKWEINMFKEHQASPAQFNAPFIIYTCILAGFVVLQVVWLSLNWYSFEISSYVALCLSSLSAIMFAVFVITCRLSFFKRVKLYLREYKAFEDRMNDASP